MTFDSLSPEPENTPESDMVRDVRGEAPHPEQPLVLSGRDRFVIRLIDAAVKIGSDDFQARYRPVTEELFTHHVIDPTAKPAYVQPDLEPIVNLETTEDPLEIIRLHLDSVIEDRQTRDAARIGAEAHLADVSAQLAESQAHAADLQQQLITQTARAEQAEAEMARLEAELQNQVSALHQQRENEVGELSARLVAEAAALTAQREDEVFAAHQQREAELSALTNERDAQVAALHQQRENELVSLSTERDTQVAELQARLASEIAALSSQRENEVAALRSERDATIAGLHAQRETEVASLTSELAEVRAHRDAQVAELTARLESQVSELEGSRTSDVTALAAEHDTQLDTIHAAHEQQLAELKAAHDQHVAELTATHEQQVSELSASHDQQTGDAGAIDTTLAEVRTDLAAAVVLTEQLREDRDRSNAQRDAAVEELDSVTAQRGEWENRLRLTVAALATPDVVGDWTDDNAPDERLVEFVRSTTTSLEQKITRIEQIATDELVDENETNEYAIGANDAAVRVLNALDDSETDTDADTE